MKKILNSVIIILILILVILISFMIYSNANSDKNREEDLKEKVKEEVSYLDSNLILLLNALNNISYENYKVETTTLDESDSTQSSESQGGNGESGEQNNTTSSSESLKQSRIVASNILNNDRNAINWNELKQTIEVVYSSWAVIELDLHALNVNSEDILSFSDDLKEAVIQIKKEDKQNSLIVLANCYLTLARIVEGFEENYVQKQVLYTKANIISAYSIVEAERWDDCSNYLKEAENRFSSVVNDVSINENKQSEVSKVYVLVKEMQESLEMKDVDLFYINYKNTMQTIENIE